MQNKGYFVENIVKIIDKQPGDSKTAGWLAPRTIGYNYLWNG
jgi:hypothetical protein